MGGCKSKAAAHQVADAPTPPTSTPAPAAASSNMKRSGSNRSLGSLSRDSRRASLRKKEQAHESSSKPATDGSSTARRGTPERSNLKPPARKPPLTGMNGSSHQVMVTSDPQWKILWQRFFPCLIDPADVHAVLSELISDATNRLSPTEITLLQRRVRQVVRSLGSSQSTTTNKMMRFYSTSTNDGTESKSIVEKQHLLDESVVRKIWMGGDSLFKQGHSAAAEAFWNRCTTDEVKQPQTNGTNGSSIVDPIGAAYCLMLSLSHTNWDRAAEIAVESAKGAGIDMDVNHHAKENGDAPSTKLPPIPIPLETNDTDLPAGISFSSLSFLVSLALRGTRYQRLHLLFYLMMSPKALASFLALHPAGGIPTFLLEVGNNAVISLASLSHYYYYGKTFLPIEQKEDDDVLTNCIVPAGNRNQPAVSSVHVVDAMATLLYTSTDTAAITRFDEESTAVSEGSPARHNKETSSETSSRHAVSAPPSRASSGYGFSLGRRNSNERQDTTVSQSNGGDGSTGPKSELMDYLGGVVRESAGGVSSYKDSALEESMERFWNASKDLFVVAADPAAPKPKHSWTLDDFSKWADSALDDAALDAILHRMFATGILPSPSAERDLVLRRWVDWQQSELRLWSMEEDEGSPLGYLSRSVRKLFHLSADDSYSTMSLSSSKVWGGLGGYDDRGGLGHGILYCVDRKWWDAWESYVGWAWDGGIVTPHCSNRKRPGDLSTERLLDRSSDAAVAGTLGSYEVMKSGLKRDVDYVLVPPAVWNVLYELYGGGPPLPRMVLPPLVISPRERTVSSDSKQMEEEDIATDNVEVVASAPSIFPPLKLPEEIGVATHPWVIHGHMCDAQQPYRRGDAGPMSIRVMAAPDQPLWRLYAELIGRLTVNNPKAADADGLGRARLWKKIDQTNNVRDASSRYGPWSLLCKNRFATLPLAQQGSADMDESYRELKDDWRAYADHATVESVGLSNGDRIMVEYAVLNKNGQFVWPREAAAKAGRVRHLAEEDAKFRRMLRGVDERGVPLKNPPELAGMTIDAMDASGRWYQVEIAQVENNDTFHDSDGDEEQYEGTACGSVPISFGCNGNKKKGEVRQVRVDFSEYGGHSEWIDFDSDRLATAGRFTLGRGNNSDEGAKSQSGEQNSPPSDIKSKSTAATKKVGIDNASEQNGGGKVCTFPGYGACGLANLGNTCYANSALQCISYMPLLRAYVLSGQYKTSGDLNKDNPLGTGGKLLEEFAELLRVMWSGKYGERSPTRFRSQLGKARSQFSGADQQDAQELLNYMLDVLHEDSNKIKKKPYVEALEDDWVKQNSLPRVGQEAWRRFLRRNHSIMADVVMGQVLNTVTCPVCRFSSRNFDPFNLLSLPFPTVADVVFQCTVVRRGTPYNCSQILNRARKGEKKKYRYERRKTSGTKPPSEQLVFEQYVIAMSRLADIGDLKMQLQNISGIQINRLKLCKAEEVVVKKDAENENPIKSYLKVTALPDKEGPCVHVARPTSSTEEVGSKAAAPTQIIAFESTLNARPLPSPEKEGKEAGTTDERNRDEEESSTADEDEDDEDDAPQNSTRLAREHRAMRDLLDIYGTQKECRVYDSDPLPISKAISRCLWPKSENDFKLGLRVDAIDHRNHWFPGSVVEIVEGVAGEHGDAAHSNENATKTKVRVHFDNFSSKWDENYTIDQFQKGSVRPLYSHATPRVKPTEFMVHHRYLDRSTKNNALFGQAFYLQCQNEWSTARAGAHILAQASRFLNRDSGSSSAVDVDAVDKTVKVRRLYDKCSSAISDLIDILLDYDRQYVRTALGVTDDGSPSLPNKRKGMESFRNPSFDASALSTALIEKVRALLYKLPFEVRVCTADAPLGGKNASNNDEVPFPFSLMRTIGNFINARHCVVLHWRDPPIEKKSKSLSMSYLNVPVMYVKPEVTVDKASLALLDDHATKKSKNNPGSGGLHLGVCLTEFCKVQQLHLTDNWRCPRCKEYREGKQNMNLWRLPDVLTFHIKRFNCSARWREKISTKVNFPLTGLDVSEWCHKDSPALLHDPEDSYVYDLIGVLNHYGGMTGGHYVAACKATACGTEGREEAAYNFNGVGASFFDLEENSGGQTGWRLGRSKDKEAATSQNKVAAAAAAKATSESAEPLWLQFDDDVVEPIPPRNVVSEMAYVLFYRRRRMTPANIAKYSTLE